MRRLTAARVRQIERIQKVRCVLDVAMYLLRRVCRRVDESDHDEGNRKAALSILVVLLGGIQDDDVELRNRAGEIATAIEKLENLEYGRLIGAAERVDMFSAPYTFDPSTRQFHERPEVPFFDVLDSAFAKPEVARPEARR